MKYVPSDSDSYHRVLRIPRLRRERWDPESSHRSTEMPLLRIAFNPKLRGLTSCYLPGRDSSSCQSKIFCQYGFIGSFATVSETIRENSP